MRSDSFLSLGPHGFHRVVYTDWGDPASKRAVVCVHGLTRNCRDFDVLAAALSRGFRVACMDVVGRGDSDWLEHREDYGFPLYQADAAALIARITAPASGAGLSALASVFLAREKQPQVDWIGTSMGGLLGMMLAAQPGSPIRRLVLNDVGPFVPLPALMRLKSLTWGNGRFQDLEEVERHVRASCATFGPLTDAQWTSVVRHGSRRMEDGSYILAYDPGIGGPLRQGTVEGISFGADFLLGVDLWRIWETVKCPTLVIRGGESDVLQPATVARMRERGAQVRTVEFAGIGHAPWLVSDEQVRVVRDFLLAPQDEFAS